MCDGGSLLTEIAAILKFNKLIEHFSCCGGGAAGFKTRIVISDRKGNCTRASLNLLRLKLKEILSLTFTMCMNEHNVTFEMTTEVHGHYLTVSRSNGQGSHWASDVTHGLDYFLELGFHPVDQDIMSVSYSVINTECSVVILHIICQGSNRRHLDGTTKKATTRNEKYKHH